MILLKLGDDAIKGDSTVEGHENWITCDAIQAGASRSITHSAGGKDRDTSNPNFTDVVITKSTDIASTDLFMQSVMGKSLGDKAQVDFIQTGGEEAKKQVFMSWFLHEPIISSFSLSSSGDRPMEHFTISFTKIQVQYNQFQEGKDPKTGKKKGWDVMKNQVLPPE